MSSATRLQPGRRPHWNATDDAALRAAYGQHTAADLAEQLGRSVHGVRWRARTLGLATGHHRLAGQTRAQHEIKRLRAENDHLRAENDHLRHGALDAAHAPAADARRLAVLIAYRLQVIDAAEAAVVLGVPPARLLVEVAKAAKLGQDITHAALEGA